MSRGQSTTRLTRSTSKALENYVSPVKKTKRGDDVTPPPPTPPMTPGLNVIVLDGESGVDHYEKGVGNANFSAQKLSTKGTTRFKLPQTVSYSEEEVKLVHYIFAEDLPPDELLVQTMTEVYSRKTLWSLCPESCVNAGVITALACHLTLDEHWRDASRRKCVCFLPAKFQDLVMNYGMTPRIALETFHTKFLSKALNFRKVCLPVQDTMDDGGIQWILMQPDGDKLVPSLL
ncbi:unnamed protein product [Linum trigynum]|uniref:Uncharacterized protein n=1 Tax=Linum trigynum TaxID=586398 RepID=A0AAV2D810_9ROSI